MGAQVMKTYAIASIATTAVEVVVPNGTKKVPLAEWPHWRITGRFTEPVTGTFPVNGLLRQ